MSQRLLVECARTLDHFAERVKYLTRHADGFQEVRLASRIDDFLAGIVPVKVHDGFLEFTALAYQLWNKLAICLPEVEAGNRRCK